MTKEKDDKSDPLSDRNYQFPEGRNPARHFVSRGQKRNSQDPIPEEHYRMNDGVPLEQLLQDDPLGFLKPRQGPMASEKPWKASERTSKPKTDKGGEGNSHDKHKLFDTLLKSYEPDRTVPSAEATIDALNHGLTGMSGMNKPGAPTIGKLKGNRIR